MVDITSKHRNVSVVTAAVADATSHGTPLPPFVPAAMSTVIQRFDKDSPSNI